LKVKHKQEHDEVQRTVTETQRPKAVQQKLPKMFDLIKKWNANNPKSKELDRLVMEMIATDNHPFHIVSDAEFQG